MHFGLSFKQLLSPRLAALSLVLLLVPTAESAGQAEWQRTVEVIVPVEEELVTRPLTDSIVAMIEAQALSPKRTPQSDTTATLEEIEAALSGEGLALTSATHVFITYRFTQKSSRLRRDILDFHFIYRPSAEQGEDIPILYLDLSKNNLHQRLLAEKGTPVRINEAAFRSFEGQLRFSELQEEATVVRVGDRVLRDAEKAATAKRQILRTIQNLTYE
jgi:hypothetical protein